MPPFRFRDHALNHYLFPQGRGRSRSQRVGAKRRPMINSAQASGEGDPPRTRTCGDSPPPPPPSAVSTRPSPPAVGGGRREPPHPPPRPHPPVLPPPAGRRRR